MKPPIPKFFVSNAFSMGPVLPLMDMVFSLRDLRVRRMILRARNSPLEHICLHDTYDDALAMTELLNTLAVAHFNSDLKAAGGALIDFLVARRLWVTDVLEALLQLPLADREAELVKYMLQIAKARIDFVASLVKNGPGSASSGSSNASQP